MDCYASFPNCKKRRYLNNVIEPIDSREAKKIPREKILSNLEKYGNTSAATIPLMMDEAVRDYRIKQNDIIATSGFGAGLSWGAALILSLIHI